MEKFGAFISDALHGNLPIDYYFSNLKGQEKGTSTSKTAHKRADLHKLCMLYCYYERYKLAANTTSRFNISLAFSIS